MEAILTQCPFKKEIKTFDKKVLSFHHCDILERTEVTYVTEYVNLCKGWTMTLFSSRSAVQ